MAFHGTMESLNKAKMSINPMATKDIDKNGVKGLEFLNNFLKFY